MKAKLGQFNEVENPGYETPRYQTTRIFQIGDSEYESKAYTAGSSYMSFGPTTERKGVSEQSSNYTSPNTGILKLTDVSNTKKSYLKRDFTPESRTPRNVQFLTVNDERGSIERDIVESPRVPVFRSISDNSSHTRSNQPFSLILHQGSSDPLTQDREMKRDKVISSLLPALAIIPRAIDSQSEIPALSKRSSKDHYLSHGGHYFPAPLDYMQDSFARKISFNDMMAQPSPFIDGGRITTKIEERCYIHNRNTRMITPFSLRVEKVDNIQDDSWTNSQFALVDATQYSAVFKPKNDPKDAKYFKRGNLSIPHSHYNVKALEINRSGETVYVTSDQGCHAFNIYSGQQLHFQSGNFN